MSYEEQIRAAVRALHPHLNQPAEAAIRLSAQLDAQIRAHIAGHGPMRFRDFMQRVLYEPGLGYYSAGLAKIGEAGDFVTAPELSALFSRCLARQCAELWPDLPAHVLEIGAGRGTMAVDMMLEWEALGCLPDSYQILEVSADLQVCQRQTFTEKAKHLLSRVSWLQSWPSSFDGIVVANEVLDALPVAVIRKMAEGIQERAVIVNERGEFDWTDIAADSACESALSAIPAAIIDEWPQDYVTELSIWQAAWLNGLARMLQQGIVLLIDYGFPRHEYYLPERVEGTLMCHLRHFAHANPLCLPGLQDITAHVDFTAVTEAACAAGLQLMGYTHQAAFLQSAGILSLAESPSDVQQFRHAQQLKRLLLPGEMGELFKVIAFSKATDQQISGFSLLDLSHRL